MRFTMRDSAGYPNATKPAPIDKSMDVEAKSGSDPELETGYFSDDASSLGKSDLLGREVLLNATTRVPLEGYTDCFRQDTDPCLTQKMRLVNNAIDEIGFTVSRGWWLWSWAKRIRADKYMQGYHWK
jgi:hypothetical protein